MKIVTQKNGTFNDADRLELAKLLVKAGYLVRISKDKPPGKTTTNIFVEYLKEGEQSYGQN